MAITKLTPEDQAAILYWPEIADIPIIDKVNSRTKQVWNKGWSQTDFGKVDFRAKVANGDYDNGIAILAGKTLTGRYANYLVVIDFDGADAIEEWFGLDNTWEQVLETAKCTRIEWHQDKSRLHMFLLLDRPIANKKIHIKNSLLEIRSENQLVFVAPSRHKEGNRYAALETSEIVILGEEKLLELEAKIETLCEGYMSDSNKQTYTKWLEDPANYSKLGVGQGRHNGLVHLGTAYFYRYHGEWRGVTDEQRRAKLWEWNTKLAVPKPEAEFDSIWKWIVDKHRRTRDELHEKLEEQLRNGHDTHDFDKPYTFSLYHENIKASLDGNLWTEIGKNPIKWIVADSKMRVIYKAHQYDYEITVNGDKSEQNRVTVYKLSIDNIIIRCIPVSVIKHESPLDFLIIQTNYTVRFKDTIGKTFTHTRMSLTQIMEHLKDDGYVMSGYGATEALSAIITAFREDGKLQVEKSVDFEGYYYCDGDIQRSGVLSEFGRVENYGRDEKLVETFKNAIDRLICRHGRREGKYDFPFLSLSPLIINGNPFISRKGEILKRLHTIKYTQEDRHDKDDSRTVAYNELMQNRRHDLRILGDWTINYVWDNRHELLLNKKYDAYQLMDIVIRKFYEIAGIEFPEWLGRWIPETSLEELDVDEEDIIRAVLFNRIHEVLRQNSHLLDTNGMGDISLDQRIGLCLDHDLLSFIRRKTENNTEVLHVDSSILMLFETRLSDLTLKRLGEKMGLNYHHTKQRWVLRCTRDNLWKFLL